MTIPFEDGELPTGDALIDLRTVVRDVQDGSAKVKKEAIPREKRELVGDYMKLLLPQTAPKGDAADAAGAEGGETGTEIGERDGR